MICGTAKKLLSAIAAGALGVALLAPETSAQSSSSTLRWGSGILDIPVASVLPHMAIVGTYSGFGLTTEHRLVVNGAGEVIREITGEGYDRWLQDGSVAIGLFDRLELGATIQHYDAPEEGGNLLGGFARLSLMPSSIQGFDLAVGARYVSSPTFGDRFDQKFQPNRLGYPDSRFIGNPRGGEEFTTNFSPYVVATSHLPGIESGFLPEYDVSLTLGWGMGQFSEGGQFGWYGESESAGIFVGSTLNFAIGTGKTFNIVADFNGFDANAGVELDFGGIRVGAFALGLNHAKYSTFRSKKFGVMASLALCPGDGGLCKSELIDRPGPDTVQLPAPPPDTLVIEREVMPELPVGTATTLCLATGAELEVFLTPAQDTLVGPFRTSMQVLRPGLVFAGTYAAGRDWLAGDDPIRLDARLYFKSGNPERLDCDDIMRVGDHEGVSLFGRRSEDRPYEMIYVPVTPGLWQRYEFDLQRTRG